MGLPNVVGLKNGTAGWSLAGYALEAGADRLELPDLSEEGIAAAEAYADRLAEEDGVQYIDADGLQALMARRDDETVYLVDVRTEQEYADRHIPGFRWFAGGAGGAAFRRSRRREELPHRILLRRTRAAPQSPHHGIGRWDMSMCTPCMAARGEWQRAAIRWKADIRGAQPLGIDEARGKVRMLAPSDVPSASQCLDVFGGNEQTARQCISKKKPTPQSYSLAQASSSREAHIPRFALDSARLARSADCRLRAGQGDAP